MPAQYSSSANTAATLYNASISGFTAATILNTHISYESIVQDMCPFTQS